MSGGKPKDKAAVMNWIRRNSPTREELLESRFIARAELGNERGLIINRSRRAHPKSLSRSAWSSAERACNVWHRRCYVTSLEAAPAAQPAGQLI